MVTSFAFMFVFPLGKVVGEACLGGIEIPHGSQQLLIVTLQSMAPHQECPKPSRKCNQSIGSMIEL